MTHAMFFQPRKLDSQITFHYGNHRTQKTKVIHKKKKRFNYFFERMLV